MTEGGEVRKQALICNEQADERAAPSSNLERAREICKRWQDFVYEEERAVITLGDLPDWIAAALAQAREEARQPLRLELWERYEELKELRANPDDAFEVGRLAGIEECERFRTALTIIAECDEDASAKDFPTPRDEMIAICKRALAREPQKGEK